MESNRNISSNDSILIISGNSIEIETLEAELKISGYLKEIYVSTSTEKALELLGSYKFELIIFDCTYTENENQVLANKIENTNTPTVLISDKAYIKQSNNIQYLPSSHSFSQFLNVVDNYIQFPKPQVDKKNTNLNDELIKYKDLFDRASDIILLIDFETHYILDANNEAIKTYGYSYNELIGMSLLEIIPRNEHKQVLLNTNKLLHDKILHSTGERTHIKKDGTKIQVSISASLIKYGNNLVFQDIVRDETNRLQNEKRLQDINEELTKKNKELEYFNHVFVGREFRIKELKEQIKALKRRISELEK